MAPVIKVKVKVKVLLLYNVLLYPIQDICTIQWCRSMFTLLLYFDRREDGHTNFLLNQW